MSRKRIATLFLGIAAAVLTPAVVPPTIASAGAAAAPGQTAFVRAAHLSPDTAAVDVYLTAFSGGTKTLWLSDVGYGDISNYRRMAPGQYAVSMRKHGAAPSSAPALTWTIELRSGRAYTAAAIGEQDKLHGVILMDTLAPPPAGSGLVRVIEASSHAGHVALSAVGGPVLCKDCAFGETTGYVTVRAGRWTVVARSRTHGSLTSSVDVSINSQSIVSLVVLDSSVGGVVLKSLVDAKGAANPPQGPIPAGGGGTAPAAHSDGAVTDAVALAVVLSVALWGFVRRRRSMARSG